MDDFAGKVVLVTGAARACGRVIADDFARRGARFVHADVGIESEVAALVDSIVATEGRLDCAVNNAGAEATGLVADSEPAAFSQLVATNLEGVRACLKHEIRAMRTGGGSGGAIVNMSSVTSDLTAVPENGLYAATKGGVDALTKAAAIEVAEEGISVNSLAFLGADVENGMFQRFFETAHVPLDQIMASIPIGRLLKPEELCAAVRFLCSDDARFVVGTTLVLDGGFTAQ